VYTGVGGRGTARSITRRASAGGIDSARPSSGMSYTADRVGNCPTTRARSSICSGRVRYSISAQAASGCSALRLMASCDPPSAAVDVPDAADGIGATAKRPATCDSVLSCISP
jgi:hypothetical protein